MPMHLRKITIGLLFGLFVAGGLSHSAEPKVESEDGFVTLFDGKSLKGWQGSTDGYVVEDGVLTCLEKGGGNLYTDKEYDNFVVRFEFLLTPGANNGLGLRVPRDAKIDPAFSAIEIQILDDSSPMYAKIHEYQHHGSVYGVVPAKTGHLKPVGEWNTEEVYCSGNHIRVVLNGETIVDADVAEASKNGTIDGRDHPGLKRTTGHIAFCGHGAKVSFRNIRVKEL